MKFVSTMAMCVLGLAMASGVANAGGTSLARVPVDHVYAPAGFDSNDNAEVIISGYLPNLCYKAARAETKVNGREIDILVRAVKTTESVFCPQMVVPFLESASAGVLDKGIYQIQVNAASPNKVASMKVVESTSSAIDDAVYAGVEYIERVPGTRRVLLKGHNPSDCYALDGIKSINNGKDSYSVLPILRRVAEVCTARMVPFTYEWDVPTELAESTVLLHVRVMNGKSVNALFGEEE